MKSFDRSLVVAMREKYDSDEKKYRIQVHFRNACGGYSLQKEKDILYFIQKYSKDSNTFSKFEKACVDFVKNLKNVSSSEFTQVNDDQDLFFYDSAFKEMRCCNECSDKRKAKKMAKDDVDFAKNKGREWLTLNDPNNNTLWDFFYKSLSSGQATVGFEDYVTGITIRGAVTDEKNEFSLARCPEKRYEEKKRILDDLLDDIDKKRCPVCYQKFISPIGEYNIATNSRP